MTYLYETIPAREGDKVKQFEIKQSVNGAPLTKHPETGEPIENGEFEGGICGGHNIELVAVSAHKGGRNEWVTKGIQSR